MGEVRELNNEAELPPAKKIKLESEKSESKGIQEADVGILQYISDSFGFYGVLKQRYTDFLVNEIGLDGEVTHLVDEGVVHKKERRREKRQVEREEGVKEEKPEEQEKTKKYTLSDEHREKLLTYVTEEELAQIEELFTTGNNMETKSTFEEKKRRGELHQLIREAFQNKLETLTTPQNTFGVAIAKNSPNTRHNPNRSENGIINYGLGPFKEYLHFTVYKENKETMEIASMFSKILRIPSKTVRFAGTKDRRGVTVQKMCIQKMKVDRVNGLNRTMRGLKMGGFSYQDAGMGLGDLKGNEFLITIRDVKSIDETQTIEDVVEKSFESLKTSGFINFFGMQRFGTFSISTHQVGIKILQEDWKGAAELILSKQEFVAPDSVEAREIWAETSNASLALAKMPRRCAAEHSILQQLVREKKDEDGNYSQHSYFQSIMQIPRNLRIMYAHAYQSYIWNYVASKRFELFGLELVVGDLVIDDSVVKNVDIDENGDEFEEDIRQDTFIRAKALTEEDIQSGKYTIYDVVLPTPGFDILYPENEKLKKVYADVMIKDNLDPLQMSRRVREFSLAGSYRNIISKPAGLSYEIKRYSDPHQQLIRTDLEILQLKKADKETPQEYSQIVDGNLEGEKVAVILKMQLGVSEYATMALRELMKTDTARRGDTFNVKTAESS